MTMTGLLVYSAFSLMVLTVLSNRYWRGHIARCRSAVRRLQDEVEAATRDLRDAAQSCGELAQRFAEAEQRTLRSELEAGQVEAELEAMRQAAVERYYVFDRLEPRSGRFWEAAIRRSADGSPRGHRRPPPSQSWSGVRRYLLVADGERDARERVTARFQAKAGFDVAELMPCRLAALAVNRAGDAALPDTVRVAAGRGRGRRSASDPAVG
ncbi:hypothetical protein [Azospirillum sp. ST 5-10]|uniref:hypothetical protein n=1 Tax=unclassified Azospirillum TaxID=2630922 RepID=UPI003F49ECA5